MEKKNRGNEKILYHGTKEDNVQDICTKGFNRSYCGINGKFKKYLNILFSIYILKKVLLTEKGFILLLTPAIPIPIQTLQTVLEESFSVEF
jgi:hypothetical protein